MRRGEVWWADHPSPASRHPVVLLSWDADDDFRDLITVAQVTTRQRGLDAEVGLGPRDGLPVECVANLDVIATIERTMLSERICQLSGAKMRAIERAAHLSLGMPLPCNIAAVEEGN